MLFDDTECNAEILWGCCNATCKEDWEHVFRYPRLGLKGDSPIEVGRESRMRDIHTFGCLIQYLKVDHDKEKRSNKFVSRTTNGVFLGMAQKQIDFFYL